MTYQWIEGPVKIYPVPRPGFFWKNLPEKSLSPPFFTRKQVFAPLIFFRKKVFAPQIFFNKKSPPPCRWSRPGYLVNFDPSLTLFE